jgi:hypothetical protein
VKGTKERSFSGKFAGDGTSKTGPGLASGSGKQQLRESIKRGRRGLNRVALIFLGKRRRKDKGFTTEDTEIELRGHGEE